MLHTGMRSASQVSLNMKIQGVESEFNDIYGSRFLKILNIYIYLYTKTVVDIHLNTRSHYFNFSNSW
jgi:hypothetical protein